MPTTGYPQPVGADRALEQHDQVDHGRLKARLRPMRGLNDRPPHAPFAAGHAFVHSLRCGHYAISADLAQHDRVRVAFDVLVLLL
jgi:IS6 family transposase